VATICNPRNERHRGECSEGETVSPQQAVSNRERHSQTDLSSNQLEMSKLSTVLLHFIYTLSTRELESFHHVIEVLCPGAKNFRSVTRRWGVRQIRDGV